MLGLPNVLAAAATLLFIITGALAQNARTDPPPDAHAPIFADLAPADARRRAAKENKLLIIKATAEWCGPCKRMDRTTFRDPRVVDWIEANAIAIQLDVDKMPGGAKVLRINAMPTTIVFKGKAELDRVVGYQDADQLLAFLEGAQTGLTHDARVRAKLADLKRRGDAGDMDARYDYASELLRNEQYEKATDEFEWLWNHILENDPSYGGVRSSFMAGYMERLADSYPPARDRFAALRDALEPHIQPDESFDREALSDWIVLNEVVGDKQRTIEWVHRIATRDDAQRYFAYQHRIFDILSQRGDWATAALTLAPPELLLRRFERLDPTKPPLNTPEYRSYLIDSTADQYAALLAAGHTDDARAIALALFRLDDSDSTKGMLAARAARAGIPEADRRAWERRPDAP